MFLSLRFLNIIIFIIIKSIIIFVIINIIKNKNNIICIINNIIFIIVKNINVILIKFEKDIINIEKKNRFHLKGKIKNYHHHHHH
jgi:hypothetical protein